MSKISLLREEVKVLDFINSLQEKINEITYIDNSFDNIMEKHFTRLTDKISESEKIRLRIILFNLEELDLIEGDVLKSPRLTEEGKELLKYHKDRNKILYGLIGSFTIFYCIKTISKIFIKK